MAESPILVVNGQRHEGFESAQVVQAFGASLVATSFSVEYAPRADSDADAAVIEPGDDVVMVVGDEELVHGYVERASLSYDANGRKHSIQCMSRLVDAVKCSARRNGSSLRDVTLFEIVSALLERYPVTVIDVAQASARFDVFRVSTGESIVDAIARAARARGVMLYDAAGDLVIGRVGQDRTATVIERGVNVLRGERLLDWSERFSEYHFCGQTRATDELYGLDAAQIGQTVEDREVSRVRELVVQAHAGRREDLGHRAILERNARAGRSERLTYELRGWTTDEGALWRPNVRVRVVDDWLGVDAELLVVRVTHAFGSRGSSGRYRTSLELTRPEAFAADEYPTRGRGQRWR